MMRMTPISLLHGDYERFVEWFLRIARPTYDHNHAFSSSSCSSLSKLEPDSFGLRL